MTTNRAADPFIYCLNTSTIRGQGLSLDQEVEIAAKAGYQAIEPWMNELEKHRDEGKSLADLGKKIADLGLTVESAIGFFDWIVDDDSKRRAGLENAKRAMDLLKQIGGKRVAAPPVGATDRPDLDLLAAAERYAVLLKIGHDAGVVPQVEVWGFSQCLHRLGQAAYVAIESGHPDACILADVYHIYKGGGSADGLRFINGKVMHVFHVNDYPADPPLATIKDEHRVYPGDGVAPFGEIIRILNANGYRGALSLELFNREYWKADALTVAKTGLEKTRRAVASALSA